MAIESQRSDGSTVETVENDKNFEPISAAQHAVAEAVARRLLKPRVNIETPNEG